MKGTDEPGYKSGKLKNRIEMNFVRKRPLWWGRFCVKEPDSRLSIDSICVDMKAALKQVDIWSQG